MPCFQSLLLRPSVRPSFLFYFRASPLRNTNVPHDGFRKQQQLGPSAAQYNQCASKKLSQVLPLKNPRLINHYISMYAHTNILLIFYLPRLRQQQHFGGLIFSLCLCAFAPLCPMFNFNQKRGHLLTNPETL